MARRVILLALVLGGLAAALWGLGFLGPREDGVEVGGEEGAAPGEVGGPEAGGAPDPAGGPGASALAVGTGRAVARSRPPTVDGPRIVGRVTDRGGRPVPGAYVVALPDTAAKTISPAEIGEANCPATDTVTDAEGRFAVAVSKDAARHAVVAQAAGWGPAILTSVATFADVTLVLDAAGSLVGTVTDAEGNGLVGAKVRVLGMMDVLRLDFEAVAGPGGAYRLDGLPALAGRTTSWWTGWSSAIEVTAEGFAPVLVPSPGDLEAGKERRKDFVLVRGARVSGRVLDAETGRPVAGARVVAWSVEGQNLGQVPRSNNVYVALPWAQRPMGETTSDAEGRFALERLPCTGFHPAAISSWGRRGPTMGTLAAWTEGTTVGNEDLPMVPDGTRLEIDVKVWPAATVEGRVVDAAGAPVPKAQVTASVAGRGTGWVPAALYPGVPVAFRYEGGDDDGRYRLVVPASAGGPSEAKVVGRWPPGPNQNWTEQGDGHVTVSVAAGATVAAPDLVLAAPAAAAGFGVDLLVTSQDGQPVFGAMATISWFGMQSRTDAEGRVKVQVPEWFTKQAAANPQMGPAQILVTAPGFGRATLELPASAPAAPLPVVLKPGRRVAGRVVREDGTPLSKGRVAVADGNVPVEEVWPTAPRGRSGPRGPGRAAQAQYGGAPLDAEGRFLVEDLPEGPYHVAAWPSVPSPSPTPGVPTYGVASGVVAGAQDVEVRMPPGAVPATGTIEGRVVDVTTKRPVAGISASLGRPGETPALPGAVNFPVPSGRRAPGVAVPSPGTIEANDVPVGTWTLLVAAEGYRPVVVENVVVRVGETTRVGPVTLDRGVRVRGRLRFPEGTTAGDRSLLFTQVGSTGQERTLQARVERDGSFEQTGFTPGTYRVMAFSQGWSGTQEPAVVPGLEEALTVREGEVEVTYDVALLVAGTLTVQPMDDRLPPAPWGGGTATEAQTQFGKAARVVVKDAEGQVLAEQTGLSLGVPPGRAGYQVLPAGSYLVRYEAPGEEAREATVAVRPNETVVVTVDRNGVNAGVRGATPGRVPLAPVPASR